MNNINWLLFALLAAPITLILHELGHYVVAKIVGAKDLAFHWASISYDEAALTSPARSAAVAIAGPIVSYAITLICWWLSRDHLLPLVAAMGFFAPIRGLVGLGFVIQSVLGRDLHPDMQFDEFNAARAWGISPFITVLTSLAILVFSVQFFSRGVWLQEGGLAWAGMVAGSFLGLYLWSHIGPIIFPGGAGFE